MPSRTYYSPTPPPTVHPNPRTSGPAATTPTGAHPNPRVPNPPAPTPPAGPITSGIFGAVGDELGGVSAPFGPPPVQPAAGPSAPTGDFDLSQPGPLEGAYYQHGGQFFTPSKWENYTWGQLPGITGPGMGQDFAASTVPGMAGHMGQGNLARAAYFQAQNMRPDLGGPGLGPYYDNAKRRASESINQQAAARGAYGSSAALDQNREAFTNLEAERANREADYNLRRAAEQRGWAGLGGQLGAAAEASQLDWMQGLGGLAMDAEKMDLARKLGGVQAAGAGADMWLGRMLGGMNAAAATQGAREGRIRGGYKDLVGFGAATGPMIDQATYQAILTDLGLTDQQMIALLGGPAAELESGRLTGQKVTGDIGALLEGGKTLGAF